MSKHHDLADPEAVARRLIDEGFTAGDLEVVDEVIADGSIENQNFGPDHAAGAEGLKAVIASLHRAFSDFRLTIEDVTVAGDVVWMRNVATGTHDGTFMGYPPTGRSIRIDVFDVVRVVDGKIVEHWGVPDRLGVLLQIGALRPPAPQVVGRG